MADQHDLNVAWLGTSSSEIGGNSLSCARVVSLDDVSVVMQVEPKGSVEIFVNRR